MGDWVNTQPHAIPLDIDCIFGGWGSECSWNSGIVDIAWTPKRGNRTTNLFIWG